MASKRRLRRKQCESKRAYPTIEEAQQVRNRQAYYEGGRDINVYKCQFCGLWHLAHPAKWLGTPHGSKFAGLHRGAL